MSILIFVLVVILTLRAVAARHILPKVVVEDMNVEAGGTKRVCRLETGSTKMHKMWQRPPGDLAAGR